MGDVADRVVNELWRYTEVQEIKSLEWELQCLDEEVHSRERLLNQTEVHLLLTQGLHNDVETALVRSGLQGDSEQA